MKIKEYFKVVLILPGNVLVTIPLLIFLFTRNSFSYGLINFISPLFYITIFFLVIGLWLAIWSVRTFYFKGGDGTPGPWKPISKLVIVGPYRYVRNPMLIGVVLIMRIIKEMYQCSFRNFLLIKINLSFLFEKSP